jgi:hypothetical protein
MEARIGERPVCESCKTGNGFKARAIVVEPTARVEVEKPGDAITRNTLSNFQRNSPASDRVQKV